MRKILNNYKIANCGINTRKKFVMSIEQIQVLSDLEEVIDNYKAGTVELPEVKAKILAAYEELCIDKGDL